MNFSTSSPIKVWLADPYTMVKDGIKHILQSTEDISVVRESSKLKEVLKKIKSTNCDVLLVELSLIGNHPSLFIKKIKKQRPHLPLLLLSIYPENHLAVQALKSGAEGYFSKENPPAELINAVRKLSQGKRYISLSLAKKLSFGLEPASASKILSHRELEVMHLITQGKRITQIAEKLSLNVRTVSTYRSRILEKLNLESNAEIIRYSHIEKFFT